MRECGGREVPAPVATSAPAATKVPKYASLPTKYGLTQHPIYPQPVASNLNKYEEEFDHYKNQTLSPPDTDLLEYWGVSA